MSLLLDALKRAEQEKLTRQGDRPAPGPALRAASAPTDAANSALELAPVAPAPTSGAPRATDAAAAQAMFKAKAPQESSRNRGALLAAAAAIVILLVSVGAYVWYSVRSLAPPRVAATARVRPPPLPPPPADLGAPRPEPFSPASPPTPRGAAPASAAPAPVPTAIEPPAALTPSPTARLSAADQLLKSAAPGGQGPVKLARTREEPPRVPMDVVSGYDALVAGDLGTAARHYAAAIEADPANVDAHLGLATVEARRGNPAASAAAYRRALALDPQNATALAGLAALADFSRPEALESDLRTDLAHQPQSAALNLTLGNLYAAQGRWSEAQSAYFEAHRLQPENPDIAYDLAVSLDHLGQRRPAAEFYRRALEARRGAAAQFDAAAAARRLSELTR
jgi:tetratricopeptide (TPR) repeat protein